MSRDKYHHIKSLTCAKNFRETNFIADGLSGGQTCEVTFPITFRIGMITIWNRFGCESCYPRIDGVEVGVADL